jgi:DNA (cytosine-5)-methyltransferase 1
MVGSMPGEVERFSWPQETHGGPNQDLPLLGSRSVAEVSVFEAIEDLAFLKPGWEAYRHCDAPVSGYQRERRNGTELLFNHLATRHRSKAVKMFRLIPEGGTINAVPNEVRSAKRTMARLDRTSISNTVLALPDDLIHYRHDRIPTVREMARLQTFDDDYVFIGKRTSGFMERRVDVPQYTQVGNAVPPVLGRALGRQVVSALGGQLRDVRDLEQRRLRHRWLRGSSGFAGYTLDGQAHGKVDLRDINGRGCNLPISSDDPLVLDAERVVEWKNLPVPRRRQWAPGVEPPRVSRVIPAGRNREA